MSNEQRDIDALRLHIPDDEYQMFEAYYRSRLHDVLQSWPEEQGLGTNPYAAEEALLQQLQRESEGRDSPDGLCVVPISIDE